MQTLRYTVYNQKTRIRIVKLDENGEILGGAHLALYDADGNKIQDIETSEGCPFYTVEGLTPGAKYILKEEEPAPGYTTAKYKCFRIKGRNEDGTYEPQVIEMVDEPTHVQISVIEDNPENTRERIGGVTYHIEDMYGEVVYIGGTIQEYVSDPLIDVDIKKLPIGTYRLVVDKVPTGYLIPEPTEITVRDSTDLQKFSISVPYTKVEIAAVDKETGKVLQKARADLMTESGEIILEDRLMAITEKHLQPGNYLIHVTQGPSGYLPIEDTPITIEATPDVQRFTVELDHTRVKVTAIDYETGQRINGVRIDLFNKNDLIVAHNAPLDYEATYLPSGQYTVKTVRVPDQYLAPADLNIYVRQSPDLQEFEVALYKVRAAFRAVDASTNAPVKGVRLKLRDNKGNIVGAWTTNKGWRLFRPIEPGSYMLQVKKVPSKYKYPKTELIEIKNLPDIQYFELKLNPKETPESTKGSVVYTGYTGYTTTTAASSGAAAATAATAAAAGKAGAPATGDDLNLMWLYLALAMEAFLAVLLFRRRRTARK